jgi:AraC-like DNA-binding protein
LPSRAAQVALDNTEAILEKTTMQTISEALNLSTVYQGRVFHSNEKVASHAQVANELADHDLHWRRGAVDTALFKARVNRLQLLVLRYGAQVEVRPRPFHDFALVHMSLKGCTEFECDGQYLAIPQGRAAIIAPQKNIRMVWGEDAEQLILKIPNALLRELHGPSIRGENIPGLPSGLLLPAVFSRQWELLLHSLLNILAQPSHQSGYTAWIDHFERNVALFLMAQYQHGQPVAAKLPGSTGCTAAVSGQGMAHAGSGKRLDALERYMRAKLGAPVVLADLAQAAGTSVRSLNILCNRHHGVSPMELLRNMRLDAAHAAFMARPEASVTDTALAFGFGHPGRFSAYYRQRFGHLPRHVGQD